MCKSNRTTVGKIKTISSPLPPPSPSSPSWLSRSRDTSTIKPDVQFSEISLRARARARARIYTIFIRSNFPRQVDARRRDAARRRFCRPRLDIEPSHSKFKSVESRVSIQARRDRAAFFSLPPSPFIMTD
jgi:hypothetical protein